MRIEFTKAVKRAARDRSDGRCEASGLAYGLDPGQRCDMPLANGVRFDHANPDALSKDASLENCRAVCVRCHAWKTNNVDKPQIAKSVKQKDKHEGITARKRPWPKQSMRSTRE